MFFMHLCKQPIRYKDVLEHIFLHDSTFCWLTLRNCITMQGKKKYCTHQNVMCIQYVVKHNLVLDGMLIY